MHGVCDICAVRFSNIPIVRPIYIYRCTSADCGGNSNVKYGFAMTTMMVDNQVITWFIVTGFLICISVAQLSPDFTRRIKDDVSEHLGSKSHNDADEPDELDGGFGDLMTKISQFGRESGQLTVQGRSITYTTHGRIHSIDELWIYDCKATDVKTGVQVEAKHFKKKRDAMETDVQRLFDELKSRDLIKDESADDDKDQVEPITDNTTMPPETVPSIEPATKDGGGKGVNEKEEEDTLPETKAIQDNNNGTIRFLYGAIITTALGVLTAFAFCTVSKKSPNRKIVSFKTHIRAKQEVTDICPDIDGYYTHLSISQAKPTTKQLDSEENYVMHLSQKKGLVLIVNNDCFFQRANRERKGSEVDLANVKHIFEQIGFESVIYQNLSADGIRIVLNSLVERINAEGASRHSSVVLVLMSHGQQKGILGTDEKVVTLNEIMEKFSGRKCPALLDKPKMMFIQACRGQKVTKSAMDTDFKILTLSDNITSDSASSVPGKSESSNSVETDGELPDNADMFIACATSDGYFSLRSRVNGSWFIQAVCEELIAKAHVDDLDTMMNRVTRRVTSFIANVPDEKGGNTKMMQTPHISKQGIRKKINFLPKYPPTNDIE